MSELPTIINGFLADATSAAIAMATIAITIGVIRLIRSRI
ncbi:hypothetical protein FACS189441_5390 [Betaproteobacteria bacterium]|nr:hypothetical protein FACS189441_5390 [Betaproteobacteria bacterium]